MGARLLVSSGHPSLTRDFQRQGSLRGKRFRQFHHGLSVRLQEVEDEVNLQLGTPARQSVKLVLPTLGELARCKVAPPGLCPKTGRDLTARMGEVCGSSGSATDTTFF